MTEEELEEQIQSYNVEDASLPHLEHGRHAPCIESFTATTHEHERRICSTFQFRLPDAWRKTKGRGVRVALLDTGIDTKHPDLACSIAATADFTGQGIEDLHGHGTHCAGIVGAHSSRAGLTGVAQESQLLIGKVLNNDGLGSFNNIADGVDWAVDSGAHIICMSMAGPRSSPLLYRSINYALAKGVHIICAAENSAGSQSNNSYPNGYGGAITVASHGHSGISSQHRERGLAAPGQDIWSTYKDGSYRELTGSSMAASFVAGIAALIVSRHLSRSCSNTPIFNCEDLRAHLTAMSTDRERQPAAALQKSPFLVSGNSA